ncbi:MAG: CDC48 family AAA ATPase [Candidatus Nitrosopelagicus sp.]|nr:CDC48 family AAA ATPase [Candidatus Nitrosopelagicus sp.]MBT3762014.1 CDC48 family AAA ATPase [Candidatus Nitrosopelagicus sp.]MBT4327885.1 CDC48 family AAA ATPase [Candidatus Nitrosopelagicus sp.]MBT5171773.1 CDC48 family AAA ATPase [Candidatus Nitrosopelagicus sp.]MBT6647111.1 CDC48 family AAA ATPase [Nitrososphaerota archaeon]
MTRNVDPLQMRVGEAKQRDIGKKRARIGPDAMDYLQVTPGDVIQIDAKKSTCAIVWPTDEDEKYPDTIRIDGQTRKNLGVALSDVVEIKKIMTKPAKAVTLMPVVDQVTVDKEFTDFVKNRLKGLPLSHSDEISVMILGNAMEFKIDKISPKGVVRIERTTNLTILSEVSEDKKSRITYEEVGGLQEEIKVMREIVELPLRHPELFVRLGIEPHSGILLYGPPGCGKTLLAKVLASESEATMYSINGPEIMNKYYGETEAKLRDIFKEAKENSPSIIFIDEIDAIAPKREEAYGDVEKRVVAQLLALMDGLTDRGNVVVLGATNRPDSVDPALRRPGRFDREMEISVPNADGRLEVMQIHTRGMPIGDDVDLKSLASELHGYTGADMKSLCREAAIRSIRRYLPEIDLETEKIPAKILQSMEVKIIDFYDAMHEVIPTAMREFYVERSKVFWEDVGGLEESKRTLQDNLIVAMNNPDKFSKMGIKPPRGALLYGPPGCGKTILARALATESGGNMILVRGPEILSKWVGESEKAIREIFRKAKASSPCVIIFDELDSLAKMKNGEEGGGIGENILSQMLTEMEEGTTSRVVIIGITNRPDLIDNSMLRTGRLDLNVFVNPPDEKGRLEIIKILTDNMPLSKDVDLDEISVATQSYSGADLASLCREAAVEAMQNGAKEISSKDFAAGLKNIRPSITKEVETWYEKIKEGASSIIPREADKTFYG